MLPRIGIDTFRVTRAKFMFIPEGRNFGIYGGNASALNFSATVNKNDYPSYEDSSGAPAFSDTTSTEAVLTGSMQNYHLLSQMIANLADEETYTQNAAEDLSIVWTDPLLVGNTFEVPAKLVTPGTFQISDGAGGTFDLERDTHYSFDEQAGHGIIRALPVGYDPDLDAEWAKTLNYNQAEYKSRRFDGLSRPSGIRGAFIIRDTHARGPKFATRFHLIEATPDGGTDFISQDALAETAFTATVYQDPARAINGNNGFFEAIELPAALA